MVDALPRPPARRGRPDDDEPDAVVVERETIELAFLAALQVLPPRQRATLIARDILDWPAERDGVDLDTTVVAATAPCSEPGRRCRSTSRPDAPTGPRASRAAEERRLLDRFIEAHERGDAAPSRSRSRRGPADHDAAVPNAVRGSGDDRAAARASAVRGRVALGADDRQPDADGGELPAGGRAISIFRALKFDVLRVADGGSRRSRPLARSCSPSSGSRRRSDIGAPTRPGKDRSAPTRSKAAASAITPMDPSRYPTVRAPGTGAASGGGLEIDPATAAIAAGSGLACRSAAGSRSASAPRSASVPVLAWRSALAWASRPSSPVPPGRPDSTSGRPGPRPSRPPGHPDACVVPRREEPVSWLGVSFVSGACHSRSSGSGDPRVDRRPGRSSR